MPANFNVSFRMRRYFFDRQGVLNKIGKAKARFLSLGGRDIRQTARKLLGKKRKRGGVSSPGRPPYVHTDDERVTLRNILYHLHGDSSVIVGPVKLNQANLTTQGDRVTVPELMERGGSVNIEEVSYDRGQNWWRRDQRFTRRPWHRYRNRRAVYERRPFMEPALAKRMEEWKRKRKYPGLQVGPTATLQIGPTSRAA